MADYTQEELFKLRKVSQCIDDLEGIAIPFNIIRQNIVPFANWLKDVLAEKEEDIDDENKDELQTTYMNVLDDGQPDEQKEWEDAEGPELPAEEE